MGWGRMLRSFLSAVMVFFFPFLHNGNDDFHDASGAVVEVEENHPDSGHVQEELDSFEEELQYPGLKWTLAFNRVVYAGTTKFQSVKFLDTKPFGKALVIDEKIQCTEKDEFIYNESLVHPALLIHDEPKTVFIMGGGQGSTAREILRHNNIEKVIMCDIDREVVNLGREHITENQEAFNDDRLHIVYNDAKDELEKSEEKFDVIVGDLSEPMDGGPCNKLYTKSFYEQVAKHKLRKNGIFVTQAGSAGILSHKDVFSAIHNTLMQVFTHVVAYTSHVPSFADEWGWVMASDEPIKLDTVQLDNRIRERIKGELRYLNGPLIVASTVLNKPLKTSIMNETHVISEENARFVSGHGIFGDT